MKVQCSAVNRIAPLRCCVYTFSGHNKLFCYGQSVYIDISMLSGMYRGLRELALALFRVFLRLTKLQVAVRLLADCATATDISLKCNFVVLLCTSVLAVVELTDSCAALFYLCFTSFGPHVLRTRLVYQYR